MSSWGNPGSYREEPGKLLSYNMWVPDLVCALAEMTS